MFNNGYVKSVQHLLTVGHMPSVQLADARVCCLAQLNRQACCGCRDDIVNLYIEAATNPSFNGTYNATAPNPVRMSELCSSLGQVLGRPSWLPVPEFALQVQNSMTSTKPPKENTETCAKLYYTS